MAVTISSMAILISAQTDPLSRDMKKAEKITEHGAKQMGAHIDAHAIKGWIKFGLALAVGGKLVKKLVHVSKDGVAAMKEAGDAGAEALEATLKTYEDNIKKIEGSIAQLVIPIMAAVTSITSAIGDGIKDFIDVVQFGNSLPAELARREKVKAENIRRKADEEKLAAQIEIRKKEQEFFAAIVKQHAPLDVQYKQYIARVQEALRIGAINGKATADMLIQIERAEVFKKLGLAFDASPLDEFLRKLKDISTFSQTLGGSLSEFVRVSSRLAKDFIESSGLSVKTDFDTFIEKSRLLNLLRGQGHLEDIEHVTALGREIEKLAAREEKITAAPAALSQGSAAAFSAINNLMRSQEKPQLDALEVAKSAAAKSEQQRDEWIRLGRQLVEQGEKAFPMKIRDR